MEKRSFLKDFEDVMGVRMTREDFIIGLLMIAAGLLVLQIGELVCDFLSSFHLV